jgi:hypothetical protein
MSVSNYQPPEDWEAMIAGCTCEHRAEGRHDMACEWVLRAAGLLPNDITPDDIIHPGR